MGSMLARQATAHPICGLAAPRTNGAYLTPMWALVSLISHQLGPPKISRAHSLRGRTHRPLRIMKVLGKFWVLMALHSWVNHRKVKKQWRINSLLWKGVRAIMAQLTCTAQLLAKVKLEYRKIRNSSQFRILKCLGLIPHLLPLRNKQIISNLLITMDRKLKLTIHPHYNNYWRILNKNKNKKLIWSKQAWGRLDIGVVQE